MDGLSDGLDARTDDGPHEMWRQELGQLLISPLTGQVPR
jgi:hypothetical protein